MLDRKRLVSLIMFAIIFQSTHVNADGVSVKGTDIVLPPGGQLIFSDNTTLSSASEKGITSAVHGIVGPDGSSAAKNCTVSHSGVGEYTIAFAVSLFSSAPDCVVSSVGHVNTSTGYSSCELSSIPSTASVNITCMKYIPTYNSQNGTYEYTELFFDTPFTFICMN